MCLILIDVQNDYFPGGNMEVVNMFEAAANAQKLLEEFRRARLPVIHVQHIAARPGATFLLPGTDGAEIHRMVAPRADEPVVVKNYPNSFRNTSLLEILRERNIENITVCGAMSHMCIDTTVRAAFDLGFNCTVAEDACATRDLQFRSRMVKAADVQASYMAALSVPFARVISTKDVIDGRK